MRTVIALGITLAVVTASCGTDTAAATPSPDTVVLEVEFSGGCAQMGPNCSRLTVYGDGKVDALRIVPGGAELVDTAAIDAGLVVELYRQIEQTDLAALHDRLPPGECRGCYDGIDTTVLFAETEPAFASVDVDLDGSEPLFAAAFEVIAAAEGVVDIPVVAR